MAYEIGTATNYLDLMYRLKQFVTDPYRAVESGGTDIDEIDPIPAEDVWTVKRWNTDWDGSGGYELILAGPGVSGVDDILVGMQSWKVTAVGAYNWCLAGFTGFSAAAAFLSQAGSHSTSKTNMPQLFLNNSSMQYWFFANGRRICGVAKVGGTYYAAFYLGYILPYGTPAAFPYPLAIGGSAAYDSSSTSYQVYSTTHHYNRGYVDPPGDSLYSLQRSSLILLCGTWLDFCNYDRGNIESASRSSGKTTWPFITGVYTLTETPCFMSWRMDKNPVDEPPLFPIILTCSSDKNIFGELHGVKAVLANGVVTEDTITFEGDTYIVFQNGRLGAAKDMFAIKKE